MRQARSESRTSEAVVRPSGPIDLASAPGFERALSLTLARADAGARVALDLSAADFMDSSGLSMLVRVGDQARARGVTLVLVDPSPAVRQLLELTRVDSLFTITIAD